MGKCSNCKKNYEIGEHHKLCEECWENMKQKQLEKELRKKRWKDCFETS